LFRQAFKGISVFWKIVFFDHDYDKKLLTPLSTYGAIQLDEELKMNNERLKKVLEDHKDWLYSNEGECADLRGADLRGANLSHEVLIYAQLGGSVLSGANLSGAYMREVNLKSADLSGADLHNANLRGADLRCADLRNADLTGADVTGANFYSARLIGANLDSVKYDATTTFLVSQCPEEGSFVAWKKCENDVLVKLLIPEDAKRSSATTRKCRASKALVLEVIGAEKGISKADPRFRYEVGKEVIPDSFDDNRWAECSHGIHFFLTRKEAENY
jgi:hypothetical protein